MTGYVRKDTTNNIADGNVINAADLDAEFDGVQDAFNASTGHNHDGTTGEGAPITALGPTQDVTISAILLAPKTNNTVDIGSSSLKFKDLFLAGNGSIGGTLAVTGVATLTAQPILSSLTASRAVFTDGSKGLVSNAITGTGNVVMSASPTLTGTIDAAAATLSGNLTLSGGTANGVAYLNGSKVVTSGSALWFDGTNFGVGTGGNTLNHQSVVYKVGANAVYQQIANGSTGLGATNGIRVGLSSAGVGEWYSPTAAISYIDNSEAMRLTSTGLGIGTSSPNYPATIYKATFPTLQFINSASGTTGGDGLLIYLNGTTATISNEESGSLTFQTAGTLRATLDSSGNLGLGVTPSAWNTLTVQQVKNAHVGGYVNNGYFGTNCFYDGTWKYIATGSASRLELTGGQHQFFTAPSGTAGNAITFTQAMTLDASGNLCIGATATTGDYKTFIQKSGGELLGLNASSGTLSRIAFGNATASFGSTQIIANASDLAFITGSAERARIDSSGNLLVGLTTAAAGSASTVYKNQDSTWTWRVESGATSLPNGILVKYSGTSPNNTGSQFIYCQDSGDAERMSVRSNGGIANYSGNNVNLSDRREKTNFAPAGSYLDKICAIPVQTFNYIDQNLEEDGGLTLGVVAQDVQAVAPELVMESNWGSKEDPKMRLSIYQTDLQYALMKCIQEQQAIIQSLKARLDAANL